MKINFQKIVHPDWRWVLLAMELIFIIIVNETVLSLVPDYLEMLLIDVLVLLPVLIGLPLQKYFSNKKPLLAEKILTLTVMLQLILVTALFYIFSFIFI